MAVPCLRLSTMPAQAEQTSSVPALQWSGSNPPEHNPRYQAHATTPTVVPLALCARSCIALPANNLADMADTHGSVPAPGQCCAPSTSSGVFLIATPQQ